MAIIRYSAARLIAILSLAMGGCTTSPPRERSIPPAGPDHSAPALWREGVATPLFSHPIDNDPSAPDLWKTRAKLAWDASNLYIVFESIGPRPTSNFHQHDDLIYQADVMEAFIEVSNDMRQVFELEVSPSNVTLDCYHTWDQAPTYTPEHFDRDFARIHHKKDIAWNLPGLKTESQVDAMPDGQTRWLAAMTIPLAQPLARCGLPPKLHSGQTLRVNLLRYAYFDHNGTRQFRQYNLVPVLLGCPHQSPMAVLQYTTAGQPARHEDTN